MLRAEAAEFKPQEYTAEECPAEKIVETTVTEATKPDAAESDEAKDECSTAVPSPELSSEFSPELSAMWGWNEEAWAAESMWGNCFLPEVDMNCIGAGSEYFLADGQADAMYTDFTSCYEQMAAFGIQPIEGIEDMTPEEFQKAMEDFWKQATENQLQEAQEGAEDDESTSAGEASTPPGLAPPPGLEGLTPMPPGLGAPLAGPYLEDVLDDIDAPPGLKARAKKTRERGATFSCGESPLPAGATTAMLRNIPNKYDQHSLVKRLNDAGFRGELDFIYLPIDFKNRCNVGYAFLNFRSAEGCARFATEWHLSNSSDKLPGYNSRKIIEVSAARFQGCDENIRRLQASNVMSELVENEEWLPMLFDENGKAVKFPVHEAAAVKAQKGRSQRRKKTA